MKKYIAALCAAALLAGCSSSTAASTAAASTAAAATTAAATAAAESTGSLKVGIGSTTSFSTADADGEDDGSIQVNTTYAGVALDGDVIKYVYFDIAQNKGTFNATGEITSDAAAATLTKKEKGDDYGMKKASAIGKEWYEQAEALEKWAVGKTVNEFVNMAVTDNDGEKLADDADLKTSCTIGVDSFLAAFQVAADNASPVTGAAKIGTGSKTTMKYTAADGEDDGSVQSNVTYAIVALDADGKVVYTQDDVAQESAKFTSAGVIDGDAAETPTKMAKGDDYGMAKVSQVGEWYQQNEAFETWTVGKTSDEISGMAVVTNDEGKTVTDDADLKTGCTIGISDLQGAVVTAIANAVAVD
ncbi:MAG: lipoprotein [Atopobium sp.]|nr:lipoprotein [Atopobium sp.]